MTPEATSAVLTVAGLIVGWLIRHLAGGSSSTPAKTPTPNSPPAPATPDNSGGLLSNVLANHPLLSLLLKRLPSWFNAASVTGTSSVQASADDAVHDHAALTGLAAAIKADPVRLATMKTLLG